MESSKASPTSATTRSLLTSLRRVYNASNASRDVFGRRTALLSEIARALAQGRHASTGNPIRSGQLRLPTSPVDAPQQPGSEG